MMDQKKPLSVFSAKMTGVGALWTKAGVAYATARAAAEHRYLCDWVRSALAEVER